MTTRKADLSTLAACYMCLMQKRNPALQPQEGRPFAEGSKSSATSSACPRDFSYPLCLVSYQKNRCSLPEFVDLCQAAACRFTFSTFLQCERCKVLRRRCALLDSCRCPGSPVRVSHGNRWRSASPHCGQCSGLSEWEKVPGCVLR